MMKFFTKLVMFASLSVLFVHTSSAQEKYTWKTKTVDGYTYKYVENDPSHTRFYTLDNGLTVILSPSHKKPRIQTLIAVKVGGKNDPSAHTGLSHYLEHMLFKGTNKFGTMNWAKEKPLIEKVTQLYEVYGQTTDEDKREEIYDKIDSISGIAAHYAIANEYDKLMASIGARGTNAHTSFEETVYEEDIPSNVIDQFLAIQAERFRHPVFRLFHTELEAVYEEKNRSLDSDGRKVFKQMFGLLFPHHNYGQQTVLGTIHDLKNPSLEAIRKHYETYYVPNNMAVIMAGDFDPDVVIKKVDEAFSYMQSQPVPEYTYQAEKPITTPKSAEVYGPEPARVMLGYRFPGASSDAAQMLNLVGNILTNGSAGLIDLDLVKKQKLLGAYAFPYVLKDYSTLILGGTPTKGQDLEEVKTLLLQEIDKLKAGNFSEDLITSIINNEKKAVLKRNAKYGRRASALSNNFILGTDWLERISYVDWLSTVTKEDVVNFANTYFHDNYVVVYKRQGKDKNTVKVEKPDITPVEVNRNAQSDFLKKIIAMPENKIEPEWVNYDEDINRASTGDYKVLAVTNEDNGLFKLDYYIETGSWSNKLLPVAVGYLNYLGTTEKSAEEFSKEFYKLAGDYNVQVSSRNTYVSIEGLQDNFKKTVAKFDNLLEHCVANQEAFKDYVKRLKESRKNAKDNKRNILSGLRSYAEYGSDNPFNHVLSKEELEALTAQDLVKVLHELADYKHKLIYYGPKSAEQIAAVLKEVHEAPHNFAPLPEPVDFVQKTRTKSKVFLTNYNMVQAEIYWTRNGAKYREDLAPEIMLFNQYFGGGMGTIVFQTIRESKALAYSAYAYYATPSYKNKRYNFIGYVGTQSDKFKEAVNTMNNLLTELPKSTKSLKTARASLLQQLASGRITGQDIVYSYLSAQKMGRDYDIRKKIYNAIPHLSFKDLENFYKQAIDGKTYMYSIIAGEGKLDQEKLDKMGQVKHLTLEEIFGY